MARPSSIAERAPPAGTILILCPGGLENGGGIGRQMGYFLNAPEGRAPRPSYCVVDTRGRWFLGASPLFKGIAGLYLAAAVLRLLVARISSAPCVAHINIAGRGSTVRKLVVAAVARAIGLRYLLHVHDADYAAEYGARGPLMRSLIARLFHGADLVLVLGGRDRAALARLLALPPDRIAVLHNAVPDPQPAPAPVRAPGAPVRLLFLGHLSERKGVSDLLRALASPALAARPWRATLAGGGPIDEYRTLAVALGIGARVDFPGWVDRARVRTLFAESDILVLPSYGEGLAMSVLEGLSHGLAVVTTPVGAHEEVIEPGISGLMVPPGDGPALAGALLRVVDDEPLRTRLRAGARRRFLEKFEVSAYAERLRFLHATLLSDRLDVGIVEKERAL